MNAENVEVQIRAGTLGTVGEVGIHVSNAKRRQVKPQTAASPIGILGQTGRTLTQSDWGFPNAIPNSWGVCGEYRMRASCIYEYARESVTIRTWASILAKVARVNAPFDELKERHRIMDQLCNAFPGPRDGWIPNLLFSMTQHLAADRAWKEINEAERNKSVVEAIATYEGQHMIAGNVGNVRNREIGVRLTWRGDERELAWTRNEQF